MIRVRRFLLRLLARVLPATGENARNRDEGIH